ncbi:unnamed protein product, partial [Ectocarpus sp. 6 AP-2014]
HVVRSQQACIPQRQPDTLHHRGKCGGRCLEVSIETMQTLEQHLYGGRASKKVSSRYAGVIEYRGLSKGR